MSVNNDCLSHHTWGSQCQATITRSNGQLAVLSRPGVRAHRTRLYYAFHFSLSPVISSMPVIAEALTQTENRIVTQMHQTTLLYPFQIIFSMLKKRLMALRPSAFNRPHLLSRQLRNVACIKILSHSLRLRRSPGR